MAKDAHLYYTPDAEGMKKIELIRAKIIELDDLIDQLTGNDRGVPLDFAVGRPVSLSKTKLEECRQRAIEAVVRLHAKPLDKAA